MRKTKLSGIGKYVLLSACAVIASLTVNGQGDQSTSPQKRMNVLFIALDDLRPQLGCYGDKYAKTPNIDKLAATGTLFNHAYCQQAVCSPSRSSLLTGRRPDAIKVWDLKTHFRKAMPDIVTLPQYFKKHNYHTQSIGKIYHGEEKLLDAPSWSVPAIYNGSGEPGRYASKVNMLQTSGFYKSNSTERADVPDTAYIDGKVIKKALLALNEVKDKPFFLAVGLWKPHVPFVAPEKYWAMYDRDKLPMPSPAGPPANVPAIATHDWPELRGYSDIPETGPLTPDKIKELVHGYYASTSFVDALIGTLLAELKRLSLEDNTIVVLWGDHGYHLGEQNLWCKTTNFELDTRVPLIISAPGKKRGQKTEALVELVDLYPTLAELAGLPAPEGLDGLSMVPLLDDAKLPWKTAAFSQFPRPWTYKGAPEVMGYTIRTEDHRYTEWRKFQTGEVLSRELYDYGKGVTETINLAGSKSYENVEKELHEKLSNGWKKALPHQRTK